jgi:hypothetical protein
MEYKINSIYSPNEIINKGDLSDEIWKKTTPVQMSNYDGKPAPEHYQTKVRSFYTDKNLYIAFEGKFEIIRTSPKDTPYDPQGKTNELWDLSDVYEVFIGPNSKETRKYRELQVAPDSRWIDLTLDASGKERLADFQWTSGMVAKSTVYPDKKIWIGVFQIPFIAFSDSPKENEIWNCNFYRISGEIEKKVYLTWSPTMESATTEVRFHKPEKYGDIVFIK